MTPELPAREVAPGFEELGIVAFTTTRAAGSFGTATDEPVREVLGRWSALQDALRPFGPRLATAKQVHGAHVFDHAAGWEGWLRCHEGDGHLSTERGTAMAVTVADCVPVFVAHPSGAVAMLHSGWRGTEAGIATRAIHALVSLGRRADELRVHCGPAICGGCYEVSPDVYGRLTGRPVDRPTTVDLRLLIADAARAEGVRDVTISERCTRCGDGLFFSHRAGDVGRQIGVIIAAR